MTKADILIIGAGPSACSAALYTLRAGFSTLMFGGPVAGGQLLQTNDIENYPGFENPLSGFELMDAMHKQCKRLGAKILSETVQSIQNEKSPFILKTQSGAEYEGTAVIIATGSRARWLGLSEEYKFRGKGVSACATCDGFFFKGKTVAVVGGGNTAFEDALFLTNFCPKVYLIHRRDAFRADQITVEKAKANPKIEFVLSSVVSALKGDKDGILNSLSVKNVNDGALRDIEVQGIFVAIGAVPHTEFLKDGPVELLPSGCIKINAECKTSVEGIFAAGDCTEEIFRQAIVAAGSGAKAGISAINFCNLHK